MNQEQKDRLNVYRYLKLPLVFALVILIPCLFTAWMIIDYKLKKLERHIEATVLKFSEDANDIEVSLHSLDKIDNQFDHLDERLDETTEETLLKLKDLDRRIQQMGNK